VTFAISNAQAPLIDPTRVRKEPPSFYFFLLPQGAVPQKTRYQHPAIALAEGFAELGLPFVSNIDHWAPMSGDAPLFRGDAAVDPSSCTAVFFTSDWLEEGKPIPATLFEGRTRPITVYLDHEDGSRIRSLRPGFPKFDLVLRAHYGARTAYPANFQPWAFGLTKRLIEATATRNPPEARVNRLLVSYRHTIFPHAVRLYMERHFLNRLAGRLAVQQYTEDADRAFDDTQAEHLWWLTGRRHSMQYYSALRQSTASACFGGYFIPEWPRDERSILSRLMKRAITRVHLRTGRITQFDSWRFWESLAASCATIQLDLEKYGAALPVMPENWVHYIGLNLDRLDDDLERFLSDPHLFERIGKAGRTWSLATYGPRPTAIRFLSMIGVSQAGTVGEAERSSSVTQSSF
jgi:hypothetical protein